MEAIQKAEIMKYLLIVLSYEFVRPKFIWLWYYLIKKGQE
jgi:hypothetical protein